MCFPCLTGVWFLGCASYCESNPNQGSEELIQCHPIPQAASRSIIMSTHDFWSLRWLGSFNWKYKASNSKWPKEKGKEIIRLTHREIPERRSFRSWLDTRAGIPLSTSSVFLSLQSWLKFLPHGRRVAANSWWLSSLSLTPVGKASLSQKVFFKGLELSLTVQIALLCPLGLAYSIW